MAGPAPGQLGLPFAWPATAPDAEFIVGEANLAAVRHLEHWSLWPVRATILTGPRKSGRSLLGRLFAAKAGATVIDDAERHDEEAVFHAWNRAQADRKPLLLIAHAPPPAWSVVLPDLASRLAATPKVAIAEPDDQLLHLLLERAFAARGLLARPEVLAWIARHIERSYVGIVRAVEAVDAAMLAERRRLTMDVVRRVLG